MIKLINMAKVLGNFELLYTQINNADKKGLSVEQIADIFELDETLIKKILIKMPNVVTEDQGLALQKSHVSVEFMTVATFTIAIDEELIFYNMLLESAQFRKVFFEKLNTSFPLNEDAFLDSLEAVVSVTEQTEILVNPYDVDFSIKS